MTDSAVRLARTLSVYLALIFLIFAIWKLHLRISGILGLIKFLAIAGGFAATVVTSWIIGARMRKRIRNDLGRKPTELDLADIDTWMKVDEVEGEKAPKDPPIS